jgi:hypothetical protein
MSKLMEAAEAEETLEMKEFDEANTDVLVDDYKDLELEIMASSREKTLWWMKHYD